MRLLEPLNGVKVGIGHAAVHLTFFISMCFIDTDIEKNLRNVDTKSMISYDEYSFSDENSIRSGDLYVLNSHHEAVDPQVAKEHELLIFHLLKWGHLLTFISCFIMFEFKKRQYYNISQFFQIVVLPTLFYYIIMYTVYNTKLNLATWVHDLNYVRCWLLIESLYFFQWVSMSIFFCMIAYCFKLKSVIKNEYALSLDDNVWNDKNTDDFLRYLKFEYFMITWGLTNFSFDLLICWGENYDLPSFGAREMWPIKSCLTVIAISRGVVLFRILHSLKQGKMDGVDDEFENQQSKKKSHIINVMIKILHTAFDIGVVAYCFNSWINNNQFENENLVAKLWIQAELIGICIQIPYGAMLAKQITDATSKQAKSIEKHDTMVIELKESKKKQQGLLSINDTPVEDLDLGQDLTKEAGQEEYEKKLKELKDELEIEEDIIAFTCLSYLKTNVEHHFINPEKQSQLLYSSLFSLFMVLTMLLCMLYAIQTNEAGEYTPNIAHTFVVFLIKFPCTIALHFVLYPEVAKGMAIMKFANQQPHLFVVNGSEISYCLGFFQVSMALLTEGINIYMLTYQHTVSHCIIHFVALEVIMEVSNMYFEALMSNPLKRIMHHPPKVDHRGPDIIFAQRSLFHKIARILYRIIRCLYVGIIFYFVPYFTIYLQWQTNPPEGAAAHH